MNDGENAREVRGPRKVRLLRQISGAAMTAGVLQVFANFAASQEVLDNIIVTGSRIERTSATTATPTTAVDAEQIGQTGELNLGEILKEVPALTAGIDSQSVGLLTFTPETVGVNQANLRGLGTDRTLVLVNGRRHVGSSPGSAAVDMNAIPTAMVERVDVITGGASAVYGADAVTGVINVILKEDFEGLEASAQYGMSERRDAEQLAFNVVAGSNFDNDKGNVYASFSYHDEEGIRGNDRADFWQPRIGFRPNPANTGPADGIPDQLLYEEVSFFGAGSCSGYFGCASLPIDPVTGAGAAANSQFVFNGNGGIAPVTGDPDPGGSSVRIASPTPARIDDRFHHIRIPVKRYLFNTGMNYNVADNHRLFFEGAFARTEADQGLSGTFDSGPRRLTVNVADNPFLAPEVKDALLSAPSPVETFLLGRNNGDYALRGNPTDRSLVRMVLGAGGEIGRFKYETYYQFGQSSLSSVRVNDRLESRYREAVDAVTDPVTGQPACRIAVEAVTAGEIASVLDHACRPLDIFGRIDPVENADAIAYFDFDAQSNGKLTQNVVGSSITGELFSVPAGDVGFAAGLEYREEESEFTPSPLNQRGDGFFGVVLPPVAGSFDVREAYAEVLVPLLSDVPMFQELSIEAAVRWADYSLSGDATSWKASADWRPVEGLRLRSSFARSVRAPNIAELFAPGVDNFPFVTHPCDKDSITQGVNPANRAANCAAAGYAIDFDQSGTTPTLRVSGSTDLEPETADTLTVGAVFSPSFLPGVTLALDYWDIQLEGAIVNLPGDTIAAFCYDSDSLANAFCDALSFHPDGNFNIITAPKLNVGRFDASGFDAEFRATFTGERVGLPGEFKLGLVVTYLDTLETQLSADAPVDENQGEFGQPQWRGNLRLAYYLNDVTLSLNERYVSSATVDNSFTSEFRHPNHVAAHWYTNVQARYRLHDALELYGGVNNLLDQDPPRYPGLEDGDNLGSAYPNIGRYFYVGLQYVM